MVLEWRYYFVEDQGIYKSAKKNLFFTNDEGKLSAEECIFSEEKWKKLDTAHDPARGIEFIDLYKSDKNLRDSSYRVSVYSEEIEGHKKSIGEMREQLIISQKEYLLL